MGEQTKFQKTLRINNNADHGVWIRSTRTLRQLIGVLGMLLPILLFVFTPKCDNPLESISHYYYVRSGVFLIVVLSLIGIFLIIYTKDFMLSSIAGICALFVVFFPTDQLGDCSITTIPHSDARVWFHYGSAAVFLVILAFMSIFKFTKPDDEEALMHKGVKFKGLYVFCGVLMLLALLLVGLKALGNIMPANFIKFYDDNSLTFWMEVVALEAFGIAWLVRGSVSVKTSEFHSFMSTQSSYV
ncbi:MAG: hypothetical protein ACON5F_11920 [Jejuia sp.]